MFSFTSLRGNALLGIYLTIWNDTDINNLFLLLLNSTCSCWHVIKENDQHKVLKFDQNHY